tara:strand:+ start:189 stop:635 length:447 start_codon:yes stop_codon:yes gene_type:complete
MTNKYDLDHIKKHLPHRDPFLFVDKVIDIKLGERIHAQRFLSPDENFFTGHFPDKPVMPGVLIIEAMAQAAGVLGFMTMNKTPEEGSIYYFAGADKVRFKKPVLPGETIDLFASINSVKSGIWKFDCYSEVKKSRICSATILCADRPK